MGLLRHVTHAVPLPTDYIPLWVYGFITGISILLVGSVILLIVCMTWRLPGKGHHGVCPSVPLFLPMPSSSHSSLCKAALRGHPAVPGPPSQVKY